MGHVGVYLRGADVGMKQDVMYVPEIGPLLA